MPFRWDSNRERGGRRLGCCRAALVALVATLAFAAPASAAEYVLEVGESLGSTGYGEVACEYKVEGIAEVEQPCTELEFTSKKAIKLVPYPEPGSEFVRFENGTGSASVCNGKTKSCSFTLESNSYIEARFDEITPSLAVNVTGEGEVSCLVEGFPEYCEGAEEFSFATEIALEPEPAEGWEFAFFENGTGSASACSGKAKPCAFTLEEDSTIEAVFVPIVRLLSVAKAGAGSGTVTSEPAGIGCGTTCSAKFPQGSDVTLKATPASGSAFAGWSGACSGTGSCVVSIEEADAAVTATFSPLKRKLTVEKRGTGTGTVTSEPAGISCGPTCSAEYDNGVEIALSGAPGPNAEAVQWSGCNSVTTEGKCKVTMSAAKTVTATFQASPEPPPPPPTWKGEGTASAGAVAKVRSGRARISLSCSGGRCDGTLKLSAKLRRRGRLKSVAIGQRAFGLAAGTTATVNVKLSAAALRELGKARSLKARAGGPDVLAGAVKLKLG